jgi:hypothetical protein
MKEGLDRHNAIHAIGSTLMQYMISLSQNLITMTNQIWYTKTTQTRSI